MKNGFCYRCEYRAQYLEEGMAPRAECKDISKSYGGCYMYKPVLPIVQKIRKNDFRSPFWPSAICARTDAFSIAEGLITRVFFFDKERFVQLYEYPNEKVKSEEKNET